MRRLVKLTPLWSGQLLQKEKLTIPMWNSWGGGGGGGVMNYSGHHCMSGIYSIAHNVMTW